MARNLREMVTANRAESEEAPMPRLVSAVLNTLNRYANLTKHLFISPYAMHTPLSVLQNGCPTCIPSRPGRSIFGGVAFINVHQLCFVFCVFFGCFSLSSSSSALLGEAEAAAIDGAMQ